MKFLKWEIIPAGEIEMYEERREKDVEDKARLIRNNDELLGRLNKFAYEADHYKKLYLDEQQKRLELAELVHRLEVKNETHFT